MLIENYLTRLDRVHEIRLTHNELAFEKEPSSPAHIVNILQIEMFCEIFAALL